MSVIRFIFCLRRKRKWKLLHLQFHMTWNWKTTAKSNLLVLPFDKCKCAIQVQRKYDRIVLCSCICTQFGYISVWRVDFVNVVIQNDFVWSTCCRLKVIATLFISGGQNEAYRLILITIKLLTLLNAKISDLYQWLQSYPGSWKGLLLGLTYIPCASSSRLFTSV